MKTLHLARHALTRFARPLLLGFIVLIERRTAAA